MDGVMELEKYISSKLLWNREVYEVKLGVSWNNFDRLCIFQILSNVTLDPIKRNRDVIIIIYVTSNDSICFASEFDPEVSKVASNNHVNIWGGLPNYHITTFALFSKSVHEKERGSNIP